MLHLERDLRETLQERSHNVPPRPADWPHVARRIRRAQTRRGVAATLAVAVVATLLVVAIPRITTRRVPTAATQEPTVAQTPELIGPSPDARTFFLMRGGFGGTNSSRSVVDVTSNFRMTSACLGRGVMTVDITANGSSLPQEQFTCDPTLASLASKTVSVGTFRKGTVLVVSVRGEGDAIYYVLLERAS